MTRASSNPVDAWLGDLRVRHTFLVVGTFRGRSAVRIEAEGAAAFHYCLSGPCMLEADGEPALRLDEGDFVFMRTGLRRVVSFGDGASRARPVPLASITPTFQQDAAVAFAIGGGRPSDERTVIGGAFCVEDPEAQLFIDALPSIFCVRTGAPYAARLRLLVDELVSEATTAAPGASPVVARLAEVAVLIGVRSYVCTADNRGGLVDAARDPRLARALSAIHHRPGARWTVSSLGRVAGMSRSAFAAEFAERVGATPADYVARLRMARAERLLRDGNLPLARIASEVGYRSQAAFSVAFKRLRGLSPSAARSPRR
jgi:AraC-like DNA-binding protein